MKPEALLLDLDGTIYQGTSLIPGAADTLLFLQNAGIPYRFITNTTRMSKSNLVLMLADMGLRVFPSEIFAPPHAASIYCQKRGYNNIMLVVKDKEIEEDFYKFQLVDNNPDAIVLGDVGKGFTFALLNNLFNHILNGSELVALHKNRFWQSSTGYTVDVGPFVSALEYASGKPAAIMGKPNANIFILASLDWGLPGEKILMVGDDIDGDIGGALGVGMQSVLVKTGKFMNISLQNSDKQPDHIINSIADLPKFLELY